ncbi:MAG: type 4a pilus biogenesis protein PilO [Candidatus Eisenbacteria bacterium]
MAVNVDIRDPRVQKIAFAAILFLGLNYLFFFTDYASWFYTPKNALLEEKRAKYERLAVRVEEAKRASANLPKLEAELEELHARWEVAMSHLPEKKEIASLLRRVTLAGERSGVRFLLFEPAEVYGHGVYDEHPVNVKVEGGYHGIGEFFGRLMNLERLVQVSQIRMKAHRTEEETQTVRGEMLISAYTIPQQGIETASGPSIPAERAGSDNGHSKLPDEDDSNEE